MSLSLGEAFLSEHMIKLTRFGALFEAITKTSGQLAVTLRFLVQRIAAVFLGKSLRT